jgi:hypothetical protein
MRVGFVEERGCRIVLLDFSDLDDTNAVLAQIEEARRLFLTQPPRREMLTLIDLSGMRYNDRIVRAFQELERHDEPWERAVAVCGLSTLGRVAFRTVHVLTGNRMQMFASRAEGVAWLLSHARAAA